MKNINDYKAKNKNTDKIKQTIIAVGNNPFNVPKIQKITGLPTQYVRSIVNGVLFNNQYIKRVKNKRGYYINNTANDEHFKLLENKDIDKFDLKVLFNLLEMQYQQLRMRNKRINLLLQEIKRLKMMNNI